MALERWRAVIPRPVTRPLRALWEALDRSRRAMTLRRSLSTLRRQARSGSVDPNVIARIRRAWGNVSFSADEAFLQAVADRVLTSPGPFLELGSGISTLIAGVIAVERNAVVWSFEQDAGWCNTLRSSLDRQGISSVRLFAAPLTRQGDFAWYDLAGVTLPDRFTHVFCDGPSVRKKDWPVEVYANWRAGVVPVLEGRGTCFDEILLDDAQDERCARLRETWQQHGLVTRIVETATGSFVWGARRPEITATRLSY